MKFEYTIPTRMGDFDKPGTLEELAEVQLANAAFAINERCPGLTVSEGEGRRYERSVEDREVL
jgi:hypothetical protein